MVPLQIRDVTDRSKQHCFELFCSGNEVIKACKTDSDGKVTPVSFLAARKFIKHPFYTSNGRLWKGSTPCTGCRPRLRRRRTIGSSVSSESPQRVWSICCHVTSFLFFIFLDFLHGGVNLWPIGHATTSSLFPKESLVLYSFCHLKII